MLAPALLPASAAAGPQQTPMTGGPPQQDTERLEAGAAPAMPPPAPVMNGAASSSSGGVTLAFYKLDFSVRPPWHQQKHPGWFVPKQQSGPAKTTKQQPPAKRGLMAERRILKGVTGVCRSGEITAIMGATGAGKSTLLDALAGRKDGRLGPESQILVDGRPRGRDFHRLAGYCEQHESLLGTLTVRETLQFSAELRLPSQAVTPEAKRARVEEVIRELSLEACADSLIGTELVRGISGGEKKRTMLGRELVTDPRLLFLDEPTTGLDAKTAGKVVEILARLAKGKGKTVVLSIHQPKFQIFRRFSTLILLHDGALAYQGPAGAAVGYFERLGFVREAGDNPADWFVDVLSAVDEPNSHNHNTTTTTDNDATKPASGLARLLSLPVVAAPTTPVDGFDSSDGSTDAAAMAVVEIDLGGGEEETKQSATVDYDADMSASMQPPAAAAFSLTRAFAASPEGRALEAEVEEIVADAEAEKDKQQQVVGVEGEEEEEAEYATTLAEQVRILSRRTLISVWRNPESAAMQFGAMFFFVALIGGIYWKMDTGPTGLQNRVGAFFLLVMMAMFSNLSALELFIQERAVYVHEKANGMYRPSAYFLARSMCDIIPLRLLPSLIFCGAIYPMLGLRPGAEHWGLFTATYILSMLTASALCLAASSLIPIFAVANLLVALLYILMMTSAGVLINFSQLPKWITPFKYISIFRYAMETLTVNELHGLAFDCTIRGGNALENARTAANCAPNGDLYLQVMHYPRYEDLWHNVLILAAMFVGCMGLAYLALKRSTPL